MGTHGALGSNLGPCYPCQPLSMVAGVPTTQYRAVLQVCARQSAQWGCSFLGDVPECSRAMDSKQSVSVSGRGEWGAPHIPACVEAP